MSKYKYILVLQGLSNNGDWIDLSTEEKGSPDTYHEIVSSKNGYTKTRIIERRIKNV